MKKIEINVDGMVCQGCENRIKNALMNIDGVENVDASYKTGDVIITTNKDIDISYIKEKICEIGFEIIGEN